MPSSKRGTQIRFDDGVLEELKAHSKERLVSVNWIVNQLVKDGLARLIPIDEFKLTRD